MWPVVGKTETWPFYSPTPPCWPSKPNSVKGMRMFCSFLANVRWASTLNQNFPSLFPCPLPGQFLQALVLISGPEQGLLDEPSHSHPAPASSPSTLSPDSCLVFIPNSDNLMCIFVYLWLAFPNWKFCEGRKPAQTFWWHLRWDDATKTKSQHGLRWIHKYV